MGSATSKSTVENLTDNLTYTDNDITKLNKQVNKNIRTNVEEHSTSCTNITRLSNKFDMSGCHVGGTLNITGVSQAIAVDIKNFCGSDQSKKEQIKTAIVNSTEDLINMMQTAITENTQKAEATSEASAGLGGGSAASESIAKNTVINKNINVYKSDITNEVENVMEENDIYKDSLDCFNSTNLKNEFNLSKCKIAKDANITDFKQDIRGNLVSECLNKSKKSTNAIKATLNKLGLEQKKEETVKTKSSQAGSAKSTATATMGSSGSSSSCIIVCVLVLACVASISGGE